MPRGPIRRASSGVPIVEVTQAFKFSAAHRMHNPRLSDAVNRRLYGRCNHPSGHGHTYRLAVTIRGPIAPLSGRVEGGDDLPRLVQERILDRFDQENLDRLIRPKDGVTSTTEVLAAVLWRILDAALPVGMLHRLRLEETPNNFFELERDDPGAHAVPPRMRPRGGGVRKGSRA
jgi:6-pyruvoyltetrahydropterin/6-carboxytetrahydropterin synthase